MKRKFLRKIIHQHSNDRKAFFLAIQVYFQDEETIQQIFPVMRGLNQENRNSSTAQEVEDETRIWGMTGGNEKVDLTLKIFQATAEDRKMKLDKNGSGRLANICSTENATLEVPLRLERSPPCVALALASRILWSLGLAENGDADCVSGKPLNMSTCKNLDLSCLSGCWTFN